MARIVAEAAYKAGAKYVHIDLSDSNLTRSRIKYSSHDNLSFLPSSNQSFQNELLAHDWARIRLDSTEEIDALKDSDPEGIEAVTRAYRIGRQQTQSHLMNDMHTWCVAAAPGPLWAARVLEQEPSVSCLQDFWNMLRGVLRLDNENPIAAWEQHGENLLKRGRILNEMQLQSVHFHDPAGTDLSVGLTRRSRWKGGPASTPSGLRFQPNLPTEEVFTTPDFSTAEGTAAATRPVKVMENMVHDARFVFKNGTVCEHDARIGKDSLDRYLDIDEGARKLGEVALVDTDSPIFQSGHVFNSILFDENAACHIALGAGYPSCLTDSQSLNSPQAKQAAGCNTSMVHTDFMIGSPNTDVDGIDIHGKTRAIIREGKFVL